jgi:peptidoglycan hydrolase-like protein with peptidoglycan-binding domain
MFGMPRDHEAREGIGVEVSKRIAPEVEASLIEVAAIPEAGDAGEAVKTLQRRLAAPSYPVGELDGVFGERTEAAVAAFQMGEGLAGTPGKWRIADYDPHLAAASTPAHTVPPAPAAVPFADSPRREVTAATFAAKGRRRGSPLTVTFP